MKQPRPCQSCGMAKTASAHTFDHEYVAPASTKFGQGKRKPLNPRSYRMETYYREVRRPAVAAAIGDGRQPCPVKSPVCSGRATVLHERATRGRFGGLPAAERADPPVLVCPPCNNYISEHPIWARENGWLLSNTIDGTRQPPRMPPRRQA